MKTLKKTLCLVMAVVMVLGIGVIPASATLDYSDNDKITYAEAVDVMSGIGVLVGDEGGFRPTDTVRRSEAAKIIAYLLIGNAKQADQLSTTVAPFTDVPASHWAAGYIAYCTQAGIINGMGDGTFQPDSPVTGLQFAKMLLCALGYNANNEYVSDDWTIMVSKDALALKVFDKNIAGANNTPATREECALYAFNILKKEKVTYSALLGGYIESWTFTNGATNEQNTIAGDFKLVEQPLDPADDYFGRECGHHWYVERITNVISADYDADKNLKATYTTGVTGADIYNLLGKAFLDDVNRVTVYADGEKVTDVRGDYDADDDSKEFCVKNFTRNMTSDLDNTGNGIVTLVYAGEEGTGDAAHNYVHVAIIKTYLAKVVDVKAGTSTKDPVTKVEVLQNWVFDNNGKGGPEPYPFADDIEDSSYNTEDFAEDDYVLVTYSDMDGKIHSMSAANLVTTTVSRYNKTNTTITVTAGGTQYVAAKMVGHHEKDEIYAANNTDQVTSSLLVNGERHTLFVDDYGYLIAVSDVEPESDYVYVAQFGESYDYSDDWRIGTNLSADIYYADGSHEIVPVDYEHDSDGNSTTDATKNAMVAYRNNKVPANYNNDNFLGIYTLTMVKGKAVLSPAGLIKNTFGVDANGVGSNVTKGISTIGTRAEKANANTVFFYVSGEYDNDNFSVITYTGINNIPVSSRTGFVNTAENNRREPEAQSKSAITGVDRDNNPIIKALLVNDKLDAGTGDTVYFYTGNSYDFNALGETKNDPYTITYEVYVDGEWGELTLEYENYNDADDAWKAANSPQFERQFFTVKNNDTHDFVRFAYRFVEVPVLDENDDPVLDEENNPIYRHEQVNENAKKVNNSYYMTSIKIDKRALNSYFNASTIRTIYDNMFSYSADEAKFVDLRELDDPENDAYKKITQVLNDWEKGNITDATFSIIFAADNDSQQISVIYLTDCTPAQQ